jgi:5-oxoprolinase (ATP-hydrolysing) subunit A
MFSVDINCDLGEGLANDAELMQYISSANIACGYHAGDTATMNKTVDLAIQYGLAIGAHPGFADKPGFGRKEMNLSLNEVFDLVSKQVLDLQEICSSGGSRLSHVKPHGALYNMSAKNEALAQTIATAVFAADAELILFGLSGSFSIKAAAARGLKTASEVFADRTYNDNGLLTARSEPNAMIETGEASIKQVLQMIQEKTVTSTGGKKISIRADTICIHGDGKQATVFAKNIYEALQKNQVNIKPFSF